MSSHSSTTIIKPSISPAFTTHPYFSPFQPSSHSLRKHKMAGKNSTVTPSRRKPPVPKSSTSSKSRSSRAHLSNSSSTSSSSDEKSQRGANNFRSFAYPERRTPSKSLDALDTTPSHPTKSNKHYVFVYGTLKKGFANAHLLERATLIGDFRTVVRFPLVVGGKFNSPYLLHLPSKGSRVKGEVYVVDDAVLGDLDHLENVGVNYARKVSKVSNCADRSFVVDAFVYFKTNSLSELAQKPFLEDYQCRRYVPRHMRPKERVIAQQVAAVSR